MFKNILCNKTFPVDESLSKLLEKLVPRKTTLKMDSHRINNRNDGKLVQLVIGWIGIVLSMIAVPWLWFCYGDIILYIIIYEYGKEYARVWIYFIIIACRKLNFSVFLMLSKKIKILKPRDSMILIIYSFKHLQCFILHRAFFGCGQSLK